MESFSVLGLPTSPDRAVTETRGLSTDILLSTNPVSIFGTQNDESYALRLRRPATLLVRVEFDDLVDAGVAALRAQDDRPLGLSLGKPAEASGGRRQRESRALRQEEPAARRGARSSGRPPSPGQTFERLWALPGPRLLVLRALRVG